MAVPPIAQSLDQVMQSRPLMSSLRNFELFDSNQDFLKRLVADIDRAHGHVGAWMFSWQADGAGTAVRDALLRARARGVDVDVVVDGIGSRQFPFSKHRRFIDELEAAGATVARAWPVQRQGARLRHVGHDHMKVFEIDGRTAWTGGRNLAQKYDSWHDYMVRFEGPAAAVLGAEHARRMVELGGDVAQQRLVRLDLAWRLQARDDGLSAVTLLRTDPLNHRTEARDVFFERLRAANREALVTTPYFGSDRAARLMADAVVRGVDVGLGVPGPNQWKNGQYAIHATRSYYPQLEGVRLLEYPFMSHAKANVIDGEAMIGTVNIGRRALELDQELMLSFPAASWPSAVITEQMARDLKRAREIDHAVGHERIPSIVRGLRRLTGFEQ